MLQEFRTLFESGAIGGLTDRQLLERFANHRGELAEHAFAMLVERHGPMVLRVCRGVLNDPADAEDAFQATFLVLLRKARGLWVRDSLGPWLHQVALRVACSARSATSRRKRHESRAAERAASEPSRGQVARESDWEPLLHQEIERLPKRYRSAIVLCDLEGLSHAQAARQLGWPVGTVKSRLSRARERLRARLTRRGLAPSVGLAAVLSSGSARAAVSAVLVRSTTALAPKLNGEFPAIVAEFAKGALKSMTLAKFRALALATSAILAATGAGLLAQGDGPSQPTKPEKSPIVAPKPELSSTQDASVPVFEATTGPLKFTVVEGGVIEPTRSTELLSQLPAPSTIRWILPEGTRVKKGDKVCELDSTRARASLADQEVVARKAEAEFTIARQTRELAEFARTEYEKRISLEERKTLETQIADAKSDVRNAEDQSRRSQRARERSAAILADQGDRPTLGDLLTLLEIADRVDAAERRALRARDDFERAKGKLEQFEKSIRPRRLLELDLEIARARPDEIARQAEFEEATAGLERLQERIEQATIRTPIDGRIVYADALPQYPRIGQGAMVQSGQAILRVVDLDAPMWVDARVREAWVDQIEPRQKARVLVHAFPSQVFSGVVESVASRPDPVTPSTGDLKLYPTRVRIEDGSPRLRPGMTAEVQILVGERDQVVRVPVQAITHYDDRDHVAVKSREGGFNWRAVSLGLANEELVEVREGLQAGDQVAADPATLMSEEDRRTARFYKPSKPARTRFEK